MKKYSAIALIFIFAIVLAFVLKQYIFPTFEKPPSSMLSPEAQQKASTPKRIVGFLPYWQITIVDDLPLSSLTEIIYFGIHTDETGAILTKDTDGNADLGMARLKGEAFKRLQTKAIKENVTISVSIILQENEQIETFLTSDTAKKRLIEDTNDLITRYDLAGINMDFEYSGIPGNDTVNAYAAFVGELARTLKAAHPGLIVSVDATADAVKKSRLYEVEKLAQDVDYIILMGYDFYRPSSSVAGPVAPLHGKEIYDYDVTSAVLDFLTIMPREKLVLGVPYYGWDFPTLDDTRGSMVEKRPDEAVALSSYKRNRQLIEQRSLSVHIDTDSQTPWMIYRDPDTDGQRQVWFEDKTSLGKKYDLVNKENIAGVAIWALGYDGAYPDLWELLAVKFPR